MIAWGHAWTGGTGRAARLRLHRACVPVGLGEESAQKRALSPPLGVWSAEDWSCPREDIYLHPPVTLTQHCDMGWRPPYSGGPEADCKCLPVPGPASVGQELAASRTFLSHHPRLLPARYPGARGPTLCRAGGGPRVLTGLGSTSAPGVGARTTGCTGCGWCGCSCAGQADGRAALRLSLPAWASGTAQAPTQEPRPWAGASSAANHPYVLSGADQVPSTSGQGKSGL